VKRVVEGGRRGFALAILFAAALAVSGFLYARSRSADFDRHARAVEAIGAVRSLAERLTEEVLAARFGLSNQYDTVTATDLALARAIADLREKLGAVVPVDAELDEALTKLGESAADQHGFVERFKSENSVLKNSVYYLPTAADEATLRLDAGDLAPEVQHLVRAALVFERVGDHSSRAAYAAALEALGRRKGEAPAEAREALATVLAHGAVIAAKQPSVDAWVKRTIESDLAARLRAAEDAYDARFGATVAKANLYRKVLYGWSLALLAAVAVVGLQLRRLYAELEQRVTQRTAELAKAIDALWGEMKLARKIQEAILPSAPELEHCDVAASMKPADEVGGDYYDVVRAGAVDWILIGDVSGHGVPAGLVMMMCQTAVRSVLEADPGIQPDKLLAKVNRVLTRNIRELGEDRYMTISALRREPDGRVVVAGAHQDVLLYRADVDQVESMEVMGMWLGLTEDLGDAMQTREFFLRPNDVLVLYSDGITEARRDGRMFEPEGIRRVLGRARGKTAKQLLHDLDGALAGYRLDDDATVLIIKRLDDTGLTPTAR
jgi:serine phosphatase RsbU (regulator of sigma subunit)